MTPLAALWIGVGFLAGCWVAYGHGVGTGRARAVLDLAETTPALRKGASETDREYAQRIVDMQRAGRP